MFYSVGVVVIDEDDDVPPSRFVKNDLRYLLIINDIHLSLYLSRRSVKKKEKI